MAESTQVTNVINFHGITMLIVKHEGVEYVYAKPLSNLAKLDWRGTRRVLQEPENAVLYGTASLEHPNFVAEGGSRSSPQEGLYIRLDRARMFLARISTKNMKAKGAVEAAEALLDLQVEWAHALHEYETQGVAVKHRVQDDLFKAIKARDACADPKERAALGRMVSDLLTGLGYPVQRDLVDESQGA